MKNVLMLTKYFYPFNCMATQRTAKLAKYLPEYGWNPIIVCPKWTAKNCIHFDPQMVDELKKYNVVKFVTFKGASWSTPMKKLVSIISIIATPKIFVTKAISKIAPTLSARKYPVEFYYESIPFLRTFLRSNKIDCVWATYPPPVTHTIADWINKTFGIPWIGDFRDIPDQKHKYGQSDRLREYRIKVEPVTLASSSAIVTVSEGLKEVLQKRHKVPVYVIPNGFDPSDYTDGQPQKQEVFSIVYTGSVTFPIRNPIPLFEALETLISDRRIKPEEISVSFYGTPPELIKRLLQNFKNLYNVVQLFPLVPFTKSIAIQKQACILLHLAHIGERGILTGKLFEYFGARRPILCIPGDNDCVDALLEQTKAGVVCRNAAETAAQLLRWYKEWKQTGTVSYYGREEEIMKYSRKEQARDLAKLLDQISIKSCQIT